MNKRQRKKKQKQNLPQLEIIKNSPSRIRKIIFKNYQSPGDIVMLTAAVRDFKIAYPEVLVDVDTSCPEIWEDNPYLTPLKKGDPGVEVIDMDYELVHHSNEGQYHFIHGFRKDMEEKLKLRIPATKFKGDIHISDEEKSWISQIEEMGIKDDFWIIFAGGKYDFTAKWWHPEYYQEVVDHFKGRITFVQCGELGHWHPPLKGVINLIGKTDLRKLIRLIYNSIGVVCPVTFGMHAAAAIEMKKTPPLNRPCVVISGGREPVQWEAYPHHRFLAVNGCLSCCDNGGCWKSRCQKVGDGDEKDEKDLCLHPIRIKDQTLIPKCMLMIKPVDVIRAIEWYYMGKLLKYGSTI
jgi:ADP-heptose:LPS heptosyltransferase